MAFRNPSSSVSAGNTAEGGTNGTTVTPANSGGASGTAFSSVNGGGGNPKFSNVHPVGSMAYRFQPTLDATQPVYVDYKNTLLGNQPTLFGSCRYYMDEEPQIADMDVMCALTDLAGGNGGFLKLRGKGGGIAHFYVGVYFDATSLEGVVNIPIGSYFRLEGDFVRSGVNIMVTGRLYLNPVGVVADETLTWTGPPGGANNFFTDAQVGCPRSQGYNGADVNNFYWDNITWRGLTANLALGGGFNGSTGNPRHFRST